MAHCQTDIHTLNADAQPKRTNEISPTRICICGAGIAGLTLAGILSRSLGEKVQLTVFERAPSDYDQGYGLDLDEHGQEALARAGVYHRYWEISREHSDIAKFMPLKGAEPLAVIFRPRLLQKLFPSFFAARPESNRGKLRDILLESLASRGNASVHFESKAFDVREVTTEAGSLAEVLDESGQVLGEYDLVVDATGLHSKLRKHFVHDEKGKHYSGRLMMHGAFWNPEATFPSELWARIENTGTFFVVGKGYGLVLQQYGGGPGDNRMSMFYTIPDREDGEGSVFDEIGIDKPFSRQSGIITDEESLAKVREWMKRDMKDVFDPVYMGVVDKLSRVTIRGEYEHGETSLRDDVSMPLVCIGDSLRNCGLGGGGILAMKDALELSDLIKNGDALNASGRANVEPLRAAAKVMLDRKNEFMQEKQGGFRKLMRTRPDGDAEFGLKDFIKNPVKRVLLRILLYCIAGLFKRWYRFEKFFYGTVGSSSTSPIFPNVRKALVQ